MNIFYLSSCPEKAAQYQYNKHVVKMILESAQLLCTAHNLLDGSDADVPYKSTHKNHPSAVWARQSSANYSWLYFHMLALGEEYTKHYLILYLRLYLSSLHLRIATLVVVRVPTLIVTMAQTALSKLAKVLSLG
mgnify:CR=1 FL=1